MRSGERRRFHSAESIASSDDEQRVSFFVVLNWRVGEVTIIDLYEPSELKPPAT